MKLPSVNYLLKGAKVSFIRFPLTIISALIAAAFGIYLVEYAKELKNIFPFLNTMLSLGLGIPLYFSTTIVSDKMGLDKKGKLFLSVFATLILILIYFSLPDIQSTHNTSLPYIKYALYNITCHLLVSFIPFIFGKQLNGFWNYNKVLFLRILTSLLYSGFLFAGLSLALLSLNLLFDVKVHEELYFEIYIVIMGVFNTWFFVSGIPDNFDELEEIEEYPRGLKTFSQFILLPLLALYLFILYIYGGKILILWDWPKGLVSYLIICVSVLGIMAFLLLYPYGKQADNHWIKKASRAYYFLLFPLLVILYIAIFMRINDYGITINRYIVLLLGIWLTIVCIYTAFGKTNIKFIPTSLATMLILISFGPWGMFAVSEKYQVSRLQSILENSGILKEGKLPNEVIWIKDSLPDLYSSNISINENRLTDSLHNEVKSILDYLDDHHGFYSIRKWYGQDIDAIINLNDTGKSTSHRYNEAEIYMKTLGLKYEHIDRDLKQTSLEFTAHYNSSITALGGYDYLITFNKYKYDSDNMNICSFSLDSVDYNLDYSNEKGGILLLLKTKSQTTQIEITELIKKLKNEFADESKEEIPESKMQLFEATSLFDIKFDFHSIEIKKDTNVLNLQSLSGNLFIKKKEKD